MKAVFWGTRGSLPAAADTLNLRQKIIDSIADEHNGQPPGGNPSGNGPEIARWGFYGTNTSCVEIAGGNEYVICDAGSGIQDLSRHIMTGSKRQGLTFNIFLSHLHWDHIQGFPFFMPRYIAGNTVRIYGGHSDIEAAFAYQQKWSNISLPDSADVTFETLEPRRTYNIAGFSVRMIPQYHPGDSYGYRFERNGKIIVYSSDCEHGDHEQEGYPFRDFFRTADLLIIDAQYDAKDAFGTKANWGHSSNTVAAELGADAGVKRLCMFHNEPTMNDAKLDSFLQGTRRWLQLTRAGSTMQIDLAHDGLEIDIGE
jgi:phosphoribosyl 1,2-cyclic phosphodiesterase